MKESRSAAIRLVVGTYLSVIVTACAYCVVFPFALNYSESDRIAFWIRMAYTIVAVDALATWIIYFRFRHAKKALVLIESGQAPDHRLKAKAIRSLGSMPTFLLWFGSVSYSLTAVVNIALEYAAHGSIMMETNVPRLLIATSWGFLNGIVTARIVNLLLLRAKFLLGIRDLRESGQRRWPTIRSKLLPAGASIFFFLLVFANVLTFTSHYKLKEERAKRIEAITWMVSGDETKVIRDTVYDIIDEDGRRVIEVTVTSFGFAVVLVVLAVVLYWIVLYETQRHFDDLSRQIGRMADGDIDFSRRMAIVSFDDIGAAASGFNRILARLEGSFREMGERARSVSEGGRAARERAEASRARATGLSALQEEADREEAKRRGDLDAASSAFADVAGRISSLADRIAAQGVATGEAADALKDVIGRSGSSSEKAHRAIASMGELAGTVEAGGAGFARAMDAASEIESAGGRVGEIARIIADIAERSNLLAMNAAIEAAHSGQAGKGFSVVAREMKALAEITARQASEIDEIIKALMDKNRAGVEALQALASAYSSVGEGMRSAETSVQAVAESADDVAKGGRESLGRLAELTRAALELEGAARDTRQVAGVIKESVDALAGSEARSEQIEKMLLDGLGSILEDHKSLDAELERTFEHIGKLGELVAAYRFSGEEGSAEDGSAVGS